MDGMRIAFADGNVLECFGTVVPESDGELRASEDGLYTEVKDSVKVWIEGGTLIWDNKRDRRRTPPQMTLERGLYLINADGLWRHVTSGV